jgi:predicted HicB family RNase H-like nuclease
MEHKKRGRPSKGDRRPVITRLPRALADAAQEHAARQGMSFNDLVGLLLSREVGVPYSDQEALSLSA